MTRPLKMHPQLTRWSPRLAARSCRQACERIERDLLTIAERWGDVNNTVDFVCDELRRQLDELRQVIDEAVETELEREREG